MPVEQPTPNPICARLALLLWRLLLPLLLAALPLAPTPARAQIPEGLTLTSAQITAQDDVVRIEWAADAVDASASDTDARAVTADSAFTTLRYGGYDLPVVLFQVIAADTATPMQLRVDDVDATAWQGTLTPARTLTPPVLNWERPAWLDDEETAMARTLPPGPIFVHSKARLRGVETQVIAISPFFQEDGVTKMADRVQAHVEGAQVVEDALAELRAVESIRAAGQSGPIYDDPAVLAPSNVAATTDAVKLIVTEPGIQQISGSNLAATGLNLAALDRLALTYKGVNTPMEVNDANGNGRLDNNETLRFYAPALGDYWNRNEVYWLSVQAAPAARMATRGVAPDAAAPAPQRSTALERGVWRNNKVYDPEFGGRDLDHWFAQRMTVSIDMQGREAEYPRLTLRPSFQLPPTPGAALIKPNLTLVEQVAEYELRLTAGETRTATLSPTEALGLNRLWSPEFTVNRTFSNIELVLVPTDMRGVVLVDSVEWEIPVTLTLNNQGARFWGVAGTWRYALTGVPANAALYDITDPRQPVRLTDWRNGMFEDGPEARAYLVSGSNDVRTPQIQAHTPTVLGAANGADALYIAPRAFMAALEPLVAHRRAQGYQVQVIDVQEIYDGWGYGHVDPVAIRSFLRYAVQEWAPSPISAVLVSDATLDPFNYKEKASNINYIPPYLVRSFVNANGNVEKFDPYWGQNGCENCYGQLDGDDPLNNEFETPGVGFMPDLWIGRFPAKSAAEVTGIVNKILRYETRTGISKTWEGEALFVADNYYFVDGSTDRAGDFIASSEEGIHLLPDGIDPVRIYYDPTAPSGHPWLQSNAVTMRDRTMELMSQGPGLVTYTGHSAHWQWAKTSECATPQPPGQACPEDQKNPAAYILGLYDIDQLSNRDQPYIGLSMTCFTSQFFEPADSGTVLDERAFVHAGGGAAAIWGPAGLSVAEGHEDLQYGFHQALWTLNADAPGTARLGQLVEAGYLENFAPDLKNRGIDSNGDGTCDSGKCYTCCQDVRRTFLLMGDPLTPMRMRPIHDIQLPLISR